MRGLPTVSDLVALLRLRTDPIRTLEAARGSAIVPLGGWPGKKYYAVNSPAAIQFFLSHDAIEIARRGVLQEIFAGSWFIARGAEWGEKRAHVLPAYNVGGHAEYAERIAAGLAEAFERWDERVREGTPLDIGAEMLALALDLMVRMLFTARLETAGDAGQLFHDCMEWNRWRMSKRRSAWLVPRNVQFRRAHVRLRAMVRGLIDAQRRLGGGGFLATLEAARDPAGRPLAPAVIESEVLNIISVGHVSSGAALTWTLYELMRHPSAVAALREEHRSAPLDLRDRNALTRRTWAAQVVAEAMRLHPPIWLFTRRALEQVRWEETAIPKGAALLFCPRVLHRDPVHWNHPDQFDPSRFETMKWPAGLAQGYFPFGAGKRQCLGKGIATLVAALVVPALVVRYDMEPLDQRPAEASPLTTLMPSKPVLARWTLRRNELPLEACG
jgi:cytochrome P450